MNINIYYFQTPFHVQWECMEKKGGKKNLISHFQSIKESEGEGWPAQAQHLRGAECVQNVLQDPVRHEMFR